MSRMNDAMIDFCELATANVAGELRKAVQFEVTMHKLVHMQPGEIAAFGMFLKAMRIVKRIKAATGEQRLRWATKLWNTIDCMDQPEALFALVVRELPDCFYEASPNGLKFTY
jgi:hypothetical protein